MCPDSILSKVRKVKPLKNVNKRLRYLSKEECFLLINACAKHLKPIVLTALLTGMRKSEILNLTWQQVDLKHGYILLDKTKNNDRREIPISKELKKLLFSIPRDPEIPYVFYNPKTKKPYTNIQKTFKNACKKAGIKDFHFHDLRHTFASHLVMNNTGLAVVKELLGHKDIKMTMRYSHLSPEYKVRAISNLENTLFSKDEKPSTVTIPSTVDRKGLTEGVKNFYTSISLGA
jgi:integrase